MKLLQKSLFTSLIVTEASHIFCCVLPTIFSVLSLMVGFGLIGAIPVWMEDLHDLIHFWEIPIILSSGAILCFGCAVYLYSKRIDCLDHGCAHEPCGKKKDWSKLILKIATILFMCNILVFGVFHRGLGVMDTPNLSKRTQEHSHEHGHKHRH